MEIEIVIDAAYEKPKLTIHTSKLDEDIEALVQLAKRTVETPFVCYEGEHVVFVKPADILRIHTEGSGLVVVSKRGAFTLKQRLYEVEELLDARFFIKISQSEIVNFRWVEGMKVSLTGALALTFEDGSQAFVSRRYVALIKKRLGMK
jgi:DNA-binding LytR/AlgR family response regulator